MASGRPVVADAGEHVGDHAIAHLEVGIEALREHAQQIALADHAHQLVAVDHAGGTRVVVDHAVRGLGQRRVRRHGEDARVHEIGEFHARP